MVAKYGLSGLVLRVSYGLGERGMVCGGWGDVLWGFGGGLTPAGIQITTGCIVKASNRQKLDVSSFTFLL